MKKLIFLVFWLLIPMSWLFAGGIPTPRHEGDSLLIFVADTSADISGNWQFTVDFVGKTKFSLTATKSKNKIFYVRLPAGMYTPAIISMQYRGIKTSLPLNLMEPVSLPADTVYLYPLKLQPVLSADGQLSLAMTELLAEDQRMVSEELADYLDFIKWFGKSFEGFGSFVPTFSVKKQTYDYKIFSNPNDAIVFIDEIEWGKTPLTARLEPGKHLLKLDKTGYVITKTYINVDSDGEITVTLTPLKETDTTPKKGAPISIVFMPFQNIGDPSFDYLSSVFSDVMTTQLELIDKISVTDYPKDKVVKLSKEFLPDFSYADASGADLLIIGYYGTDKSQLIVHAVLYDVKTELVKTALIFTGTAGLRMFESIDLMTEQFIKGIYKVLPDVDKELASETAQIKSKIITYEKKRTENEVIAKRRERKHAFSLCFAISKTFDYIVDTSTYSNQDRFDGPGLSPNIYYEFLFEESNLSFVALFAPIFASTRDAYGNNPVFDFPLYLGVRYYFMSAVTDTYFGVLTHFRYTTGATYSFESTTEKYGPYLFTGLDFEMGIKIYTYKRMSRLPFYFNTGIMFSFLTFRFETDFSNPLYVPLDIVLYLGLGSRI